MPFNKNYIPFMSFEITKESNSYFLYIDFYRIQYTKMPIPRRVISGAISKSSAEVLKSFTLTANSYKFIHIRSCSREVKKLPNPQRNVLERFIEKHNEEVPIWLKKEKEEYGKEILN